ncbi:MAG: type VI secretion system tube protein Hcp [Hamadaea sp.]|nr:type VI secretion system tube protein Hcp [Hamadaea sp.]
MKSLHRFLAAAVLAAVALVATAQPAAAAPPALIFLKIDGIVGGSANAGHKGEIELESFSFGLSNSGDTGGGGGGGAGKVVFQDFHFMKYADVASAALFEGAAIGKHYRTAVLTVEKRRGNKPHLVVTMEDVLISSFNSSGANGSDVPMESISLNFETMSYE